MKLVPFTQDEMREAKRLGPHCYYTALLRYRAWVKQQREQDKKELRSVKAKIWRVRNPQKYDEQKKRMYRARSHEMPKLH